MFRQMKVEGKVDLRAREGDYSDERVVKVI